MNSPPERSFLMTMIAHQPRRLVINAAMIPAPGTWRYEPISADQAKAWLRAGPFESYVGYEQTASYLQQLAGVPVPVSRAKVEGVRPGDELLVCRLAYRVVDPATKGKAQPEDWELGLLRMLMQLENLCSRYV
jgi:hypothetical protein